MANLPSKNISILGCGWLGLALLRSLVADGHRVYGSARKPERLHAITEAGGQAFAIDLPGKVPSAFLADCHFLIIALPPQGRRLGANAAPRYLAALRSLYGLDRIQRIVFTSSTGVYGEQEGELTELSPRQPNTHSARAVVAAENWLQEHEERVSILRLAGLIGPERHPGNFYGGKQRPIPNGDAPVNLVHRDDVISAIRLDLAQPAPGLYNVCAVAHPPKGEYYTAAARLLGRKIAGVQAGGKNAKVILSERLRDRGWRPVYDDLALSLPE